jgi:epoxyqueuosine reductase
VGLSYRSGDRENQGEGQGLVARYAWGEDYHRVMGEMLEGAAEVLRRTWGGEHRWFVDAGPAMDKALAARSGLGWYGRNTNILTERFGSYVLLGEIITTLEIEPDQPLDRDCGPCRLCVVACPTGALGPDYSLDSRRCISYLTIEHRGPIPRDLRPLMGAWVFGCDICQDVCPPSNLPYLPTPESESAWRLSLRSAVRTGATPAVTGSSGDGNALEPHSSRGSVDLQWLLRLSHDEYLERFRGTSIRRAKVWMLRRNAAVALGNVGGNESLPALRTALSEDESALVRGHAAWAIGRIGERLGIDVRSLFEDAMASEADESVRDEIQFARDGALSRAY